MKKEQDAKEGVAAVPTPCRAPPKPSSARSSAIAPSRSPATPQAAPSASPSVSPYYCTTPTTPASGPSSAHRPGPSKGPLPPTMAPSHGEDSEDDIPDNASVAASEAHLYNWVPNAWHVYERYLGELAMYTYLHSFVQSLASVYMSSSSKHGYNHQVCTQYVSLA